MVKNQCWIIILELILPIPIVRLNVDEAHQGVSASFPSRNVCLRNFTEREKERKRERKVPRWKMKMESVLSLSFSLFISHSLFQTGGSSNLGSLIRESTAKLLDQFVMLQAVINWISMEKRCGLFSVGTVERVEANDENFSKLIDKVWGRRQFNFWRGKCLFMWPFKDAFESKMRCWVIENIFEMNVENNW